MKKRQIQFILALCVVAMLVWICGEVLFGFVFNFGMTVSRVWAIFVIVGTCAFSLWKCPRNRADSNAEGKHDKT